MSFEIQEHERRIKEQKERVKDFVRAQSDFNKSALDYLKALEHKTIRIEEREKMRNR